MIETMHFRWENDTHQETKMTMGKNNRLKMYLLLQMVIFHCHVSFRGGISISIFAKMNGVYEQ